MMNSISCEAPPPDIGDMGDHLGGLVGSDVEEAFFKINFDVEIGTVDDSC